MRPGPRRRPAALLHRAQRAQRQPRAGSGGSPRSRRPSMNTSRWRCATRLRMRVEPMPDRARKPGEDQPDVGEIDTGSKRALLLGRGDQFALRGGGRVEQRFDLGRVRVASSSSGMMAGAQTSNARCMYRRSAAKASGSSAGAAAASAYVRAITSTATAVTRARAAGSGDTASRCPRRRDGRWPRAMHPDRLR